MTEAQSAELRNVLAKLHDLRVELADAEQEQGQKPTEFGAARIATMRADLGAAERRAMEIVFADGPVVPVRLVLSAAFIETA